MRGPYERPVYNVSHFIRQWRIYRGITISALAERAKLTASMISQLERGKTQFKQGSLLRIADALGVKPWHLLGIDPSKENSGAHLLFVNPFTKQDQEAARTKDVDHYDEQENEENRGTNAE